MGNLFDSESEEDQYSPDHETLELSQIYSIICKVSTGELTAYSSG